ncbi:hypothetical protein [Streptomyces sp. NPDC091371]|uniref:alpha/beta fold hydrolase n=1 Tax=Streptomyces sp. NPDC091371 TaxID=3155303 RepID=UPI003431CDCC
MDCFDLGGHPAPGHIDRGERGRAVETVDVDGVRIAYERKGHGRPVVLSGGTGMPPAAWELCGVREELVRAGFEVITYAARGVAPSDAPAPPNYWPAPART